MAQRLSDEDWALMAAGRAQVSRGEFDQALATFSSLECRTTNPRELAAILLNEAQCYRILGYLEKAHGCCDRALHLSRGNDEDTVNAWIVKTDVLVDEGRLADAKNVIDASLRRYPAINQDEQLRRLADILVRLGKEAEAIPILIHLLEAPGLEESEIATVHHTLGVSYGSLGELHDAAQHLRKAQSLQLPRNYLASNSFWLASVVAKQTDFRNAKRYLLDALAQTEQSNTGLLSDIYESLANVSRELCDDSDAVMYSNLWRASKQGN
jgi:tetratricopeptide (TPR) repeat protein